MCSLTLVPEAEMHCRQSGTVGDECGFCFDGAKPIDIESDTRCDQVSEETEVYAKVRRRSL